MRLSIATLNILANEAGLALFGITSADYLHKHVEWLSTWQKQGYAAQMQYMQRDAQFLCDPKRLLAQARSVVSIAVAYSQEATTTCPSGFGRVARYAWGLDYHLVLVERLRLFVAKVERFLGSKINYRCFSDAVPLLERALAERAGVGFFGKNSMLIRPKLGSFFFLSQIIWDLEIAESFLSPLKVLENKEPCGSCTKCNDLCPTNAFAAARTLDAGKCISYLSIEKRTALNEWERKALGEWVFGCDVCQEVCPFNHTALKKGVPAIAEFDARHGVGPNLDLEMVLSLRKSADFKRRFAKTPLLRATRPGLLRNAAVVAANTGAEQLTPVLKMALQNDASALVRQHSLWAFCKLADKPVCRSVLEQAINDPDQVVRLEAQSLLEEIH